MSLPTNANTQSDAAWHAISAGEVMKRLATSAEKGLDAAEASTRLQKYGPNRLPEGKKRGPFMRFLAQFNNILVYVLLGAGFTKLMLNLWVDAGIIFGVVVLNALLGFIQEGKAEKALDSIRNMLSAEARTVRGGETRMIPAEQLVPGDVVILESGDKIPADLRLIDTKNLRTEEAALTGESVPADKGTDVVPANATVGDRENMAFSGTMVVSGRATGVVAATGSETELGRINQLLASVSPLETPLLRQIKTFGYVITAAIAVISVLIFAYGKWVKGMDFVELFQAVVGIAVSVIPEGLPALITITLAIGVQRMAQRNAIIRRLPAVETLGSVSRICSDKTGTLTLMEMMVVSAVTAESAYQITGDGYAPEGEVKKDGKPADKDPVLALMGRVSMLCNDAELFQQEGSWKVEGDPTEGALYPFASKLGMDRATELAASPRIDAIPFESEHKFMATLHKSAAGQEALLVKGAPEVILENCDRQQTTSGQAASLDRAFHASLGPARCPRRARSGASMARDSDRQGRQSRPGRPAQNPCPTRPDRSSRPATQGSYRSRQGVPWRRHPRHDDHGRSQDHRCGHRQDARYRRWQHGNHRRRDRGHGHCHAAGARSRRRCIRASEPRAQASPGQGNSG
jgi:magnesium-transporting ATPase (P-type)